MLARARRGRSTRSSRRSSSNPRALPAAELATLRGAAASSAVERGQTSVLRSSEARRDGPPSS